MRVTFGNPQSKIEIRRAHVRRLVSALARAEKMRGGEVSLVFVNDSYIRDLNARYRGTRRATDVLAFPLADEGVGGGGPDEVGEGRDLLGEVYISTDRAVEQARRHHVALSREVARLVVHGLLHLFGYEDDTRSSRREMIRRQEAFLREHRDVASQVAGRPPRR